ncbi:PDZ domain-containing protein [Heliobacterium gestii]|uniref:PDZ domain-containing protein n=1 Tax=Heliomicrobium gestii TaxID=2699 RepID=A0A845LBN4_HELGE|nr:PDZ domain-containing protein [Heliomicrobium gestii]MBM7866739.1 hypothetical protein [Heliomicrobium gestii]MZP42981.1 PDZ domain-containing protein [Heliomicrobium gestii]
MEPWDLIQLVLEGMEVLLLQPQEYPTFWVFLFIIALLYRRQSRMKAELFQLKQEGWWRPVLYSAAFGVLAGFLGSLLMLAFGITIVADGFVYLLPVALLLAVIHVRYMCYAYAGGLISLAAIVMGWHEVSAAQIMGMVAILHLIEALLIYLSGHLSRLPVFIAHRRGMTVGAFNLQSFWPIPLLVLTLLPIPLDSGLPFQEIATPDWWPLIQQPPIDYDAAKEAAVLFPLPIVALLGYGDLAVTRQPEEHARRSAALLALYSSLLLALAVLASKVPSLALLPALFGPLGHEALILWSQRREMSGPPLFAPSLRGLRVLDTGAGSPAEKLGLRAGDVVGRINSMTVLNQRDLAIALSWSPIDVDVEYLPGGEGAAWRREMVTKGWNEPLGLIAAPEPEEAPLVTLQANGGILTRPLARLLAAWRRRRRTE